MNPFLFVVGCQRSGTTILQRVLDAHPQFAIINQSRWIPEYFEMAIGLMPNGSVTSELIPRLLEHKQFRKGLQKVGIRREDLDRLLTESGPLSYPEYVGRVFDLYGKARGKSLVGDKTPKYVRYIRTLHTLWPQARFIHLIRDGRDVCLSTVTKRNKAAVPRKSFTTWKDHPIITAAMKWEWNVRLGREAGQRLGSGLYFELSYESFVARPPEECARVCDFLGIAYDDAMLRFHEGRTKSNSGLDAKKGWRPITPGLRDWSNQMPSEDVERFEAAVGSLLDELGYRRGVPQPRSEALDDACRVRSLFIDDIRSRERLVPAGW
jgi:hypothetical protein